MKTTESSYEEESIKWAARVSAARGIPRAALKATKETETFLAPAATDFLNGFAHLEGLGDNGALLQALESPLFLHILGDTALGIALAAYAGEDA